MDLRLAELKPLETYKLLIGLVILILLPEITLFLPRRAGLVR